MSMEIREIESISFGIYSSEEIKKMAACEITNGKLTGEGSVYDERMGPNMDSQLKCVTCDRSSKDCSGHFGYIELNEPIIHPLYYRYVINMLKCFCKKCYRLLITKEQIYLKNLNKLKGEKRFLTILEKTEKINICWHCDTPQAKINYSTLDNVITLIYKHNFLCNNVSDEEKSDCDDEDINKDDFKDVEQIKPSKKKLTKVSIVLTVQDIKKIFDNIQDEDVKLLGFNPSRVHPRNLIIVIFPVIPPSARPFVISDGNVCDDDLTNQLIEIIKSNNILKHNYDISDKKKILCETKRQKALQSLKFRISTFYNNSSGKAKHPTNKRPLKGIKERVTGKSGQLRNNLMGKRCCFPDTPILIFLTGLSKRADQIITGDVIIGDDGLPRTVIGTITGESPLYMVKQSLGDYYGINCEHILTLKYCGHTKIHWRDNIGQHGGWFMKWYDRFSKTTKSVKISLIPSITKDDAENEMKVFIKNNALGNILKYKWCPNRKIHGTWRLSNKKNNISKEIAVKIGKTKEQALKEITELKNTIDVNPIIDIHVKDYLKLPKSEKRLMLGIKLNVPIKWPKKEITLDPRILGMWLGDGNSGDSRFTSIDQPIIEYCKKWTENNGGKFTHIHPHNKILHHGMSYCNFPKKLREYNLINNKHIPEDYIINDEETRLLVLAGLIDTDGSVEQDGTTIRITQCKEHKAIIDGAKRIAHSLGFRATVNDKKTSWEHKGVKKTGEAIVLTISGRGLEKIPTLLPHKKCKSSGKDMLSYKIEIEPIGIGKFCGIEVDQNNRFILGDYTVTHNCEFSGRTVIGPDPTLKTGQIAIPHEMANILTFPEVVLPFNKDKLEKMVNDGLCVHIKRKKNDVEEYDINLLYARETPSTKLLYGDIVIRGEIEIKVTNNNVFIQLGDKVKRNGEYIEVKYPEKKYIKLKVGDVVERKLRDGDILLLNRQPTLHKGSMMAKEIVIKPYKTIRMNLAATKSYNADFDGDEMNIHAPQSYESVAELKYLSATVNNMISAQSSKPNIVIVQDSLVGSYLMTNGLKPMSQGEFFDISLHGYIGECKTGLWNPDRIACIKRIMKIHGKPSNPYTGHGLFSLFLPVDFYYENKNDKNLLEPIVKIYQGVLYEGTLDKTVLNSSNTSLIQTIYKEYGKNKASEFIDNIQFITSQWLLKNSFSVGLEDCMITDKKKTIEIFDTIEKCYIEAQEVEKTTKNPGIKEVRVMAALNKAKDIGMKIAKESMSKENNLLSTVCSGSKGDFFNIAQLTGLLGQQNLKGKRVPKQLNHGLRTLPHYPFEKLSSKIEYESRGFISHSFIHGLTPQEFYFHAMSGREGICDTAMGTSTSGYIQRKIVKVCEDIQVRYDGTVRDSIGKIYQIHYGNNGFDPVETIKVNGIQQPCDISRIINRLNISFEQKIQSSIITNNTKSSDIEQKKSIFIIKKNKTL